jgi:hypothetical protein
MKRKFDWLAVQRYCDTGHSLAETLQHFGMSRLGLRKSVARGDLQVCSNFFDDRRAKHDWVAIRLYYESGKSMRQCAKLYGFCTEAWSKAVRRGDILPRPNGVPLEKLLSGERLSKRRIKTRLQSAGILRNECSCCGLREWRGAPLNMHLELLNGDQNDHRLENFRLLCPNCQSAKLDGGGKTPRDSPLHEPARRL